MGGVIRSCSQFYTEMIKVTFAVLLVGALLVNPAHSSLFERAKAAADTALFSADVFTDVANGLNLYYGPDPNTTLNQLLERAKAAADTTLFSADVFKDVANGLNLNYGPDPNAT